MTVYHKLAVQTKIIETHEAASKLEIEKTNRYDAGKYTITLENSSGKKQQSINVRIYDTPGPPGPIVIREVTRNSVLLSWMTPEIDGGSVVRNYIVEKREATRKAWSTVETLCAKTSYKISGLVEAASYFFRVLAIQDC